MNRSVNACCPWMKPAAQPGPSPLADQKPARGGWWPGADVGGICPGVSFRLVLQGLAESLAAENASRLAAMQRAEKNIDDLVESLNETFRRLRQTSIDEELFEVMSGYESLSKGKSR